MLATMALLLVSSAAGPVMELPFDESWVGITQGAWEMRVDHRMLLAMRHTSEPGQPEASASNSRVVTVPEDWSGPVSLHFYCSDDLATTDIALAHRRRKQVLLDGDVIWSADVCDPRDAPTMLVLPLDVVAGRHFTLTLLGYNPTQGVGEPSPTFTSTIYWGDVSLVHADAAPPPKHTPSHGLVTVVHERRWPLPPLGTIDGKSVELSIDRSGTFPKEGFPLTFGVPLPSGRVAAAHNVRFRSAGTTVQTQRADVGRWPDDSIQWVLCDSIVTPTMESVRLEFSGGRSSVTGNVAARETEAGVDVKGTVTYSAAAGALLRSVNAGKNGIEEVTLRVRTGDESISGTADEILLWDVSPIRTTVLLQGSFARSQAPALPFHLYASTYSGLPYLKLWLRVFNDSGADVPISGLELRLHVAGAPASLSTPAGEIAPGGALVQRSATSLMLDGASVPAEGPISASWPGGVAVVKDFRERFPRAIRLDDGMISLDCVAADSAPLYLTPGEASSHEVWVALGDVDAGAFAEAIEHPPVLRNAEYFCSTGAFGPAAPLGDLESLLALRTSLEPAPSWEALAQHAGSRDFPDEPFVGGMPNWSNNYYERMLGLWSAWLITGDRAWFEHATDTCRHLMDVAVIHSDVPGKDWRGATHGPGPNHVAGPWNPLLRVQGLSLFQKLTGEPEAREAVDGVVEFCLRSRAGMDGPNPRHQAGPFDTIATAYDETGAMELLEAGTERVVAIVARMDMRRGVWLAGTADGTFVGNVPWHAAQLARPLYLWYRATGDVVAAEALVALADAIVCESVPWDAPGVMASAGPVTGAMTDANHDVLIAPMLYAAYELTDDTYFRDAAQAQWARWRNAKPAISPLYGFWHTPWLTWYVAAEEALKAETEGAGK